MKKLLLVIILTLFVASEIYAFDENFPKFKIVNLFDEKESISNTKILDQVIGHLHLYCKFQIHSNPVVLLKFNR